MFKRNVINRIAVILSTVVLTLTSLFCAIVFSKVSASDGNKVYFSADYFEAQDSGLVYADIRVEGIPGQKVKVYYHSKGETAISGVDFTSVSNSVTITIGSDGGGLYRVAIKTLNTKDTRQKLVTYSGNETYGRYFTLIIDSAENATVTKDRCKCYLSFNSKVEATVGLKQDKDEIGYINDYKTMQTQYHKGKGNLDGKSTWKSWKNGVSFNNSDTQRWVNTYINGGFASAYTSYLIKVIDNSSVHSGTDAHIIAGNHEFWDYYDGVETGIPGTYLYITVNPHAVDDADKINGRVMYLISTGKNPYKEDSDYVDVTRKEMSNDYKRVYWIQDQDAWFADKNSFYDSVFWKIEPYKGVLDSYLAIYNRNKETDIEFKHLWFFFTLIDDTCRTITGQYIDDSRVESNGKLRFYIRFNEPVISAQKKSIEVKFNNGTTPYYADYVEGNYTDTLVYEMNMPNLEIKSATYQLPSNDIGDMAYSLDSYKKVQNNKVQNTDMNRQLSLINGAINYVRPRLAVDKETSLVPKNNYNLVLSLNDNGNISLNQGTIYYEWSKEEVKANSGDASAYAQSRRLVEEDMGSINVSLSESGGYESGSYYLHTLAVGAYGIKNVATFGPYVLDVDPPQLVNNTLPKNELKTKIYEFENLKLNGAHIAKINVVAKWKNEDGTYSSLTYPLQTEEYTDVRLREVDNNVYRYFSNVDDALDEDGDGLIDIPLDGFILGIMGEKPRISLEIFFEAEDTAGNRGVSNAINVTYDKRSTFKVTSTFPTEEGYKPITDITANYPAYDIANVIRSGKGIAITVSEEDKSQVVAGKTVFRVILNDTLVYDALPTDRYTVTINDLPAGLHKLLPNIVGNVDGTEIDFVANPISFYLTDGKKDDTVNNGRVNGDLLLTNKVFEISDAKYYYLDLENKVSVHLYGATYDSGLAKYEGGSSAPAFSNVTEAKKYVRFMEYQDISLIKLTANMASMLNSSAGTTTYVKASGEMRSAKEGQLWIRYKKNIWTTSSNAYGWAYYYYAESGQVADGIDVNRLSTNVTEAINAVVNRIVSAGTTVYLVEESQLTGRTGSPYLASSQMHKDSEIATVTKTGVRLTSNVTYEGDKGLYVNTVRIENKDYPIATNIALYTADETKLYYRYYESSEWYPIDAIDGQILADVFTENASGIYTIREYGKDGISEFDFYYDKTTPTLKVKINGETYYLDGTVVNFSGSTASIDAITGEIDDYGYVAIYSYPSKVLQTVLYVNEVDGYNLGSANYYIQVGDRSGNMATYTFLLSNTTLGLSITESQSQSGIIVRVTNRDESEIYSYEVYLNEEIILADFIETKSFKDPGIYRVVVTDIYGNTVTEVYEYEFPSPRMTWYYQNANGGYTKYDQDKIVSMIISDDSTSPRTTNIYTSARVRLIFDTTYGESDIKFEMLDIPSGDYTYSEATGVLTVNTDAGWRLRVWFEDYPLNDHVYVCRPDTESPNFDATFVGTSYSSNVKVDDTDFLNAYEVGDVINLENLEIAEGESESLSFLSGEIICGNHIVIGLFDSAGIKSYTVTRNGQPITLALNDENQLVIKNYGLYVITATDMLGNRSEFSFANIQEPVANARLDGEAIDEQQFFGSDNITVSTEYASVTSVIVKTADTSDTFIFEFDGRLLTYGRYVCTADEEEPDKKYAELVKDKDFLIDITEQNFRENKWYDVLIAEDYVISVMKSGKALNYKVACVDKEIEVQLLVYVGNNKRPSFYKVTMSKELPTLTLLSDGQSAEIIEELDYVYIAGTLTVGELSPNVTELLIGYSESPLITQTTTVYKDGEYLVDFSGAEDGYYRLIVKNKFGSSTIYNVNKIKAFTSIVKATYLDGMTVQYLDNSSVIRSNAQIELSVFSKNVRFEVNGDYYDGLLVGGMTVLELNRQGVYEVKVVATNGVFERFDFEIATDREFIFNEEWLTGYNENALLRDQGYTSSTLTVVLGTGVEYVSMVKDEQEYVIYDNTSETKVIDAKGLKNVIGSIGNGVYEVNFRNKYGDLVTKTIHYAFISMPLKIERKTLDNPDKWEKVFIPFSNYALRFSTDSICYECRIDGNLVSLDEPKVLELGTNAGRGPFTYQISFINEYGSVTNYTVVLVRSEIVLDSSSMKQTAINGYNYTMDNVSLSWEAGYGVYAKVSINGEEPIAYNMGDVFYKDGTYDFVLSDIAGNKKEYTVIHKSVNHYVLTDGNEQPVIVGGVINNTGVIFTAEDDSVVTTIVKDGKVYETENRRTFTATGHWELLIQDSIGNTSYTEFYIVNNSLGEFYYTAPYDYEITELWRTDARGSKTHIETDGKSILLNQNGEYVVSVTGVGITSSFMFAVTIDNTPPAATLSGVEDGGTTARNVTIKGLKNGDNVKIYKDGVLVEDVDVANATKLPEISTGGKYKVVVTNMQGVSTEYNFTRKKIANTATSVFFIVIIFMAVIGVLIGLLYHTRQKTDS